MVIVVSAEGEHSVKNPHCVGFLGSHLDSTLRSVNAYNLVAVALEKPGYRAIYSDEGHVSEQPCHSHTGF
jgi:hypothetical protein